MSSIGIIQIMAILYFMYAVKLKIWNTSLNTFIVISTFFILTVSRELEICREVWVDYHLTIIAISMTFIMGRVVFQSANKKYIQSMCQKCSEFRRRKDDKCKNLYQL